MVINTGQMKTIIVDNLRDGVGKTEVTTLIEKEDIQGACRLFARFTLKPGCSIGRHGHEGEEELYYIISGKGVVDDNGVKRNVQEGDATITSSGCFHAIENCGEDELEFLACVLTY